MKKQQLPSQKSEDEKKQILARAKQKIIEKGLTGETNGKNSNTTYKTWMWKGDIDSYELELLSNEEIDIIIYEYHGNYSLYKQDKRNGEFKADRKGRFKGQNRKSM